MMEPSNWRRPEGPVGKVCIYCLKRRATTRDHVPPKAVLSRPYPKNLTTIPCCAECNLGFSLDKEYFRLMVLGLFCHSPEADAVFDGPMSRSFEHRPRLEDMLFEALVLGKNRPVAVLDQARIDRVGAKVVRSLQFLESNEPLPSGAQVSCRFYESADIPGEVHKALDSMPFQQRYAPDFLYKHTGLDGLDDRSLWHLVFFGSFSCIAQVRTK